MDIRVIVAAHKPYFMPADSMYLPLQVGSEGKPEIGFACDCTGENISRKNPTFCELTGLYWAWKNVKADYMGLVHYRRHFSSSGYCRDKRERIISGKQMARALCGVDAVLPRPRNYLIETNYSQYAHAHRAEDLDAARAVIAQLHPTYLPAFDRIMRRTKGHRFNMFVMRYDCFCRYCEWLFSILFELEEKIDVSDYDTYNARVFGFIGERLLDVWLETENIHYRELPIVNLEGQNWLKKGTAFLLRKCGMRAKNGTIGYRAKK